MPGPIWMKKPEQLSFRGGAYYSEVAVELINAIYNNLGKEMVVNTRNNGAIHGFDDGCGGGN
ncbi:6-phospho-beta-glucosidase [Klebsiella oxytoca]|nr:6-phospho-beta-glucosidase [Klebsiella oxytoca]